MVTRKMNQNNSLNVPSDLPDDVPVSYTTTFHKKVGTGQEREDEVAMSEDDFRDANWVVWRWGDNGWEQCGVEKGRPHSWKLRAIHGAGRYKIVPLDRRGQPVEEMEQIELVGAAERAAPAALAPPSPVPGTDDMPPWMRLMLSQQAEERADSRRRQEESDRRRAEFEAKQSEREWQRQERDERIRRDERAADAELRRSAADRMDKLIAGGMTLAGTAMTAFSNKGGGRGERDVNSELLAALMAARQPPQQQGGGIKDTLDMLLVLDQVADRRAERNAPPAREEKDEEEGLGKALMGILPMLAAMQGGGGGAAAGLAQMQQNAPDMRGIAEQAVRGILSDPDALADIASRDPDATARVFVAAVQRNPALREAAARAFADANDDKQG